MSYKKFRTNYPCSNQNHSYRSALYIVRGFVNISSNRYGEAYSNTFFRYNFTEEVCEDMALISKEKLQ
jgi:hypothetical protein